MERVSFEVAKAIKEAGYPQGNTDKCYLTADHNKYYKEGQIVENDDGEWSVLTKNLADIPTYLEVWLWLWREKDIQCSIKDGYVYIGSDELDYYSDPEEAIIGAIEYLVDNDLIK